MISKSELPVGVFDSGVGGLSVWRAIVALLPRESAIYLADQAHVPYGSRSGAEIEALTHQAVAWLLDRGVKLVVIACNTASAAALNSLRTRWPGVPIVGMEPAVKSASERTRKGRVGVLATPGTLNADRFHSLIERFASGVEVYTQVCPGLVQMVEEGRLDGPDVSAHLRHCLEPLLAQDIDHLVLGCTHYPFLTPVIARIMGAGVTLIDPAPAVARQVQRILAGGGLLAPPDSAPRHRFYTTGDLAPFRLQVKRLVAVESRAALLEASDLRERLGRVNSGALGASRQNEPMAASV